MQIVGQWILFPVGSVYNILKWCGIALQIGSSAKCVIVERQYAYAIVYLLGGISCHTYYFAKEIGDIGVISAPLHSIDVVAIFQCIEGELKISVLFLNSHHRHGAVLVFEAVYAAAIGSFDGGNSNMCAYYCRATTVETGGRWG